MCCFHMKWGLSLLCIYHPPQLLKVLETGTFTLGKSFVCYVPLGSVVCSPTDNTKEVTGHSGRPKVVSKSA